MTADDFKEYMAKLGYPVEDIVGADGGTYMVVPAVTIPSGSLHGRTCDVAVRRDGAVPYVPPAAIHTRPALVPMNTSEPLGTQHSSIGPDWQYWSRRYERPATPARLWTHILTVLCDDRWPSS